MFSNVASLALIGSFVFGGISINEQTNESAPDASSMIMVTTNGIGDMP